MKVRGDGSQHSQPPDQLHLPPVCIPMGREQQGCLLHISTVFCLRDEAAQRVEVGMTVAWGPAELQAFVSRWPAGFLPLGRDCLSLPFGDAQAPGYFALSIFPAYRLCSSLCADVCIGPDLLFPGLLQWISNFPAAGFRSSNIFC